MALDSKAYSQASFIIQNMSEELRNKIPQSFLNMIENNKDINYKQESNNINEIELFEDTEKIFSVIYTDYLATPEEREIILNKEKILENEKEIKKQEDYSNNVFKNIEQINNKQLGELSVIRKEKWYIKILNKIKSIFLR